MGNTHTYEDLSEFALGQYPSKQVEGFNFDDGLDFDFDENIESHARPAQPMDYKSAYDELVQLTRQLWEAREKVTNDWLEVLARFKYVEYALATVTTRDHESVAFMSSLDSGRSEAFRLSSSYYINHTRYFRGDDHRRLADIIGVPYR